MKINFNLNGEDVTVDEDASTPLIVVLRRKVPGLSGNTKFLSVKRGCSCGQCGSCTVQLNGESVPSCILPVVLANGAKILTLEGIKKTPVYQNIISGFKKADIKLCGFCDSGKIFAAKDIIDGKDSPFRTKSVVHNEKTVALGVGSSIIEEDSIPSRQSVLEYINHLPPCCTDRETLATGILCAYEINRSGKNGK